MLFQLLSYSCFLYIQKVLSDYLNGRSSWMPTPQFYSEPLFHPQQDKALGNSPRHPYNLSLWPLAKWRLAHAFSKSCEVSHTSFWTNANTTLSNSSTCMEDNPNQQQTNKSASRQPCWLVSCEACVASVLSYCHTVTMVHQLLMYLCFLL